MKQGKPKLTRQDAERLFAGLPAAGGSSASRPVNPFEASPFDMTRRADEKTTLWKDNLVTLPIAFVVPAAYASLAVLSRAIVQAWRVRWVREAGHEIVAEFPEGWKAVRPATGPIELRDPSNVVRAVYGWAEDAELRLLTRYLVETQSNSSTGMSSLLIRDRASGQILERSSIWSSLSGANHPDWARLSGWLNGHFPQHQDPLRYWEDCERNLKGAEA
ncbi:hypothetical protein [Burkholderia perseverans]|uniref:hypothetical protein n=1 Tax=Burkholderia perseverans TaxID=2615214 RepID=UPI001FED59E9|nr:hypothetical protein [Burkholderia perseverans]